MAESEEITEDVVMLFPYHHVLKECLYIQQRLCSRLIQSLAKKTGISRTKMKDMKVQSENLFTSRKRWLQWDGLKMARNRTTALSNFNLVVYIFIN